MATSWAQLQTDLLTSLKAKHFVVREYELPNGVRVKFNSPEEIAKYVEWLDRKVDAASVGIPTNLATF